MDFTRLFLRLSRVARDLQAGRRPSSRLFWAMIFAAGLVAVALIADAVQRGGAPEVEPRRPGWAQRIAG